MAESATDVLSAYLWDLRAQVEAQLRALTEAQRHLDAINRGRSNTLAELHARLVEDLMIVHEANSAIRDVCVMALRVSRGVHVQE